MPQHIPLQEGSKDKCKDADIQEGHIVFFIELLESKTSEFFFKSLISSIHFRMEIGDGTWL